MPAMRWPLRHNHRYRATGHGRDGGGAGAADRGGRGGAARDARPDRGADVGGDRGRRPAGQLASVAAAPVRRYLRATRPVAPAATFVVRSVRTCVPTEQVAELSAVVGYGRRVRAVAAPVRAASRPLAVRHLPPPLTGGRGPRSRQRPRHGLSTARPSSGPGCGQDPSHAGRTRQHAGHADTHSIRTPRPERCCRPVTCSLVRGRCACPAAEDGDESDAAVGRGSEWLAAVRQTWGRVAAERGIDFDPPPDAVTVALPSLAATVDQLATGLDERDRRWLAAALAALADQVQPTTLPNQPRRPDDGPEPDIDGR